MDERRQFFRTNGVDRLIVTQMERDQVERDIDMAGMYRSHKYRVTLLVTIEEELAIMKLFSVNGWAFIRVPADDYTGTHYPMQTPVEKVPDTTVNTCTTPPSVQPPFENTTGNTYFCESSGSISMTEEIQTPLQTDREQEEIADKHYTQLECPKPAHMQDDIHNGQHVNANEYDTCHETDNVHSNDSLITNEPEPTREFVDGNYVANSYFQIPPHVIKSFAGNTEIISKTKTLLVRLSDELKGLTSSKDISSTDVGNLNVDVNQLKEVKTVSSAGERINETTTGIGPIDEETTLMVLDNDKTVEKVLDNNKTVEKVLDNNKTVEKVLDNNKTVEIKKRLRTMAKKKYTKVKPVQKEKTKKEKREKQKSTTKKEKIKKQKGKPERVEVPDKKEIPEKRPPAILYEDGDVVRNEVDKHIDAMSLIMSKNNQIVCCMCRKEFESEDLFKSHASQCLSDLYDMRGSHTYHCTDCWAYFRQAFTLLRHRHSEVCIPGQKKKAGNFLTCEFCKKSYPTRRRSEYIHHIQVHKNERPFKCEVCNKDFVRWTTLRDHKRIHTGEKPFKCNHCPLRFVSGSGQRNHELVRHADLPRKYVCEKCGASFKLRNRLTSHIKEVHDMPIMYTCEFCQKAFSRKGSLTHHRRVHINLRDKICDICGKGFIRQSALTGHMKRHRNERSFFCEECGKGFYTKMNLKEHERTHTGDKPYACAMCNYQCAVYSNAVKHARARHPEVPTMKDIIVKSSLPSVNLLAH